MSWRNIRLIYAREISDQLRDRGTLSMIAVVPLCLYPLLGMSVFQLSQFLRKSEPKVLVIGSEQLAASAGVPPLFEDGGFAASLFDDPAEGARLDVEFINGGSDAAADRDRKLSTAELRLKSGEAQVVLDFPP